MGPRYGGKMNGTFLAWEACAKRRRSRPAGGGTLTAWSRALTVQRMDRRLTPRGQERRRQLMAYATARFAENGYHPTSVAEIVQGLGVGKGVFYWYFDSKEQLFLEILREAQRQLRRAQQEAIGDQADPVDRIERGIRASIRWSAEHRDVNRLIQFALTEERFRPALVRGQQVAVEDATRHLAEAISRGEVRDEDPVVLAHAIIGLTTHLVQVYLLAEGRAADDVADVVVAFVLDGLAARRPALAVPPA
jgi:AcrR family transcriptional regulator